MQQRSQQASRQNQAMRMRVAAATPARSRRPLPHAPSAEPSASTAPLAPNRQRPMQSFKHERTQRVPAAMATLNAVTSSACDQIQRSRSSPQQRQHGCARLRQGGSRAGRMHPSISRMTISRRPAHRHSHGGPPAACPVQGRWPDSGPGPCRSRRMPAPTPAPADGRAARSGDHRSGRGADRGQRLGQQHRAEAASQQAAQCSHGKDAEATEMAGRRPIRSARRPHSSTPEAKPNRYRLMAWLAVPGGRAKRWPDRPGAGLYRVCASWGNISSAMVSNNRRRDMRALHEQAAHCGRACNGALHPVIGYMKSDMAWLQPDAPFDADAWSAGAGDRGVTRRITIWHQHARAQLLYTRQGCTRLTYGDRISLLPPARAAWIPGGCAIARRCARRSTTVRVLRRHPVGPAAPATGDHRRRSAAAGLAGADRAGTVRP